MYRLTAVLVLLTACHLSEPSIIGIGVPDMPVDPGFDCLRLDTSTLQIDGSLPADQRVPGELLVSLRETCAMPEVQLVATLDDPSQAFEVGELPARLDVGLEETVTVRLTATSPGTYEAQLTLGQLEIPEDSVTVQLFAEVVGD